VATPVLAVLLTMVAGGIMFAAARQGPVRGDPHDLLGPAVFRNSPAYRARNC
jgi:hypothetical protein